jgi:hypothetical protein
MSFRKIKAGNLEDTEGQGLSNCREKGTEIDDHGSKAVGVQSRGFIACHVMNSQELTLNGHLNLLSASGSRGDGITKP